MDCNSKFVTERELNAYFYWCMNNLHASCVWVVGTYINSYSEVSTMTICMKQQIFQKDFCYIFSSLVLSKTQFVWN